jgi:hypothetical protein
MLTSMVRNFTNFGPVGIILVVMIGVGLAEQAGLMTALIEKSCRLRRVRGDLDPRDGGGCWRALLPTPDIWS